MHAQPELQAAAPRAGVELAMSTHVSRRRGEQVIRPAGLDGSLRLLAVVAGLGEVAVQQAGDELLGDDGLERAAANGHLAHGMLGGVDHSLSDHLGLVDGRYRLRVARQPATDDVELRGIDGRQDKHGDAHLAAVVQQLGPH